MASACPRCSSPTVEITLFDGTAELTMRSCSACDHRTWYRAGEPASKVDVLTTVGTASKRKSA